MTTILRTFGSSLQRELGLTPDKQTVRQAADAGDAQTARLAGSTGGLEMPAEQCYTIRPPIMHRINRFWLMVVLSMLVIGCVTAGSENPALWRSWRGPAMVALSLAVLLWYAALTMLRGRYGFPAPRRVAYTFLAIGFVLTSALLGIDINFQGIVYALIGLAVATLPVRETYLPVGAALVMYAWATGMAPFAPHYNPSGYSLWGLFGIAMGVGITYTLSALMQQRFRLERTVRELHEAQRRLRLSAAREADLATLRERNRLAREMHDSLGHALVSIAIKLEAAQRLYAVDAARGAAEMDETKALVRSTMTELRNSLQGLRPAALEGQALPCALAEMARELGRRTGIAVTCDIDEQAALLDREAQETLYRVSQEALTNVAKHAHAHSVDLSLTLDQTAATLEVADDGVGLGASERVSTGHYGVLGMRERVEALGGVLTLGPRHGGGTVLRARVPAAGLA